MRLRIFVLLILCTDVARLLRDFVSAALSLQIQHVESEVAIAAVERNGGSITTRFFDPPSLFALRDPEKFFTKGA